MTKFLKKKIVIHFPLIPTGYVQFVKESLKKQNVKFSLFVLLQSIFSNNVLYILQEKSQILIFSSIFEVLSDYLIWRLTRQRLIYLCAIGDPQPLGDTHIIMTSHHNFRLLKKDFSQKKSGLINQNWCNFQLYHVNQALVSEKNFFRFVSDSYFH